MTSRAGPHPIRRALLAGVRFSCIIGMFRHGGKLPGWAPFLSLPREIGALSFLGIDALYNGGKMRSEKEPTMDKTSKERQSNRTSELDQIARAHGWHSWSVYSRNVKNKVVTIARNPYSSPYGAERATIAKAGTNGRKS